MQVEEVKQYMILSGMDESEISKHLSKTAHYSVERGGT